MHKIVFEGVTPRSLGYVTFSFKPVCGKSLTVELTANPGNRDAFGNIVEIQGTPEPNSAAGKTTGKATLSIVKMEIYEPVGK